MAAGYSQTPLFKKLGMQTTSRWKVIEVPDDYFQFFEDPEEVKKVLAVVGPFQGFHLFVSRRYSLISNLADVVPQMETNAVIWVSWPKKTSGIYSEITEDTIREVVLPIGLVDVKVCAVSAIWSGLKLVKRKKSKSIASSKRVQNLGKQKDQ